MLPTEQPQLFAVIERVLRDYLKTPSAGDLESWWQGCKGFGLDDVERALKSHQADEKTGKWPPKPMDVKRRLSTSTKESARCAASSPSGRCEYPGIFSDGTGGEGHWYCPWHRMDRDSPEAEAWIERSRTIPFEVASAKRRERMKAEAIRAPAVVSTAQDIARRHGNRPWQTAIAQIPFNGDLSEEERRILNQGNYEGRAAE